jgi:hypothetical protein
MAAFNSPPNVKMEAIIEKYECDHHRGETCVGGDAIARELAEVGAEGNGRRRILRRAKFKERNFELAKCLFLPARCVPRTCFKLRKA